MRALPASCFKIQLVQIAPKNTAIAPQISASNNPDILVSLVNLLPKSIAWITLSARLKT
jgi:hypothetical protein